MDLNALMTTMRRVAAAVVLLFGLAASPARAQPGVAPLNLVAAPSLYVQHCASCHDQAQGTRAPSRDALAQRTPENIVHALTDGAMSVQGKALTDGQRRALAVFLSGKPFGAAANTAASAMPNRCEARQAANLLDGPSWNGWGNGLANTRFQPVPGFSAEQVPTLSVKWAFGLPNATSAYSQPTVVGGRVYIASDTGVVYAIDAALGCVYWSFEAKAGVRTAISAGPVKNGKARYAVFFGDISANAYAVDAETGTGLWTVRVETHPLARITGAPALHSGRLYVPVASMEEAVGSNPQYECCTFRGSLLALDASTGRQIWKTYTIPTPAVPTRKTTRGTQLYGPSGSAIWSAPTIDVKRGVVYIATGDAYSHPADETTDAIIALDLKNGRRRWVRQLTPDDAYVFGCDATTSAAGTPRSETCPEPTGPDFDFGSSAMLATLPNGRTMLTAGQKSGIAWGLDPDRQGAILWQQRVGVGGAAGGVEFGPATDGERGYFATSDLHVGRQAGGLSAVNLADGALAWSVKPPCRAEGSCQPAQSAAITVIPGVVFSGTVDGIMRAYSTVDGHVLWEFATARQFQTVNQVPAHGGGINGPGPVAVGGMLYVVSGYASFGGPGAGNVLIAFAVQP